MSRFIRVGYFVSCRTIAEAGIFLESKVDVGQNTKG